MNAMETETKGYNFFEEIAEFVPYNMGRLASLLTALWVSSAAAQFGLLTDIKDASTKNLQGVLDPVGKGVAFIGGALCKQVQPLFGVVYDSIKEDPDTSELKLVYQTRPKTILYNLTLASTEIPKAMWFDKADVLKIYFHGFTDNPTKSSFQTMREAFASQGDDNILALDASSLIAFFYLRASYLVEHIGEQVGEVLAALVKYSGLNPANIHLIGHSLGSHIAGFAGKKFREQTGSLIGKITGLDPAGPCFSMLDDITMRLSKHDAAFVEVIHTDAGVYGLFEQLGHVDYYPNDGSKQPGCVLQTCSHSRAWWLYAEVVINYGALEAVKCSSYADFRNGVCDYNDTSIIGSNASNLTCGKYYLQTSGDTPFGRGKLGLIYKNEEGVTKTVENTIIDFFQG